MWDDDDVVWMVMPGFGAMCYAWGVGWIPCSPFFMLVML